MNTTVITIPGKRCDFDVETFRRVLIREDIPSTEQYDENAVYFVIDTGVIPHEKVSRASEIWGAIVGVDSRGDRVEPTMSVKDAKSYFDGVDLDKMWFNFMTTQEVADEFGRFAKTTNLEYEPISCGNLVNIAFKAYSYASVMKDFDMWCFSGKEN